MLALLGLGAAMSVIGVVWHVERTRELSQFAEVVLDVPDDVVIVSDSRGWGVRSEAGMATGAG